MPIKPQRLQPGDTLGIIAPASPPPDPENIDQAEEMLRALGFKVKPGANVRKRRGFLAGTDRERAGDLMKMFTDRSVRAILCVRGGHGVTRLLPLLDYAVIRRHPKIFAGYSDLTALHAALLAKAGLVTFHGPMLNADFVANRFPPFTCESFFRTLTQPAAPGSICQGYPGRTVSVLRGGVASGRLAGGNLTMLCTLLGTPWQPSLRRKILILEEINEAPYRVDRMLTQLLNAGLLQTVAGIAIGLNHACEDRAARKRNEFRQTLADVFRDRLLPLKVPVVMGLPFGHVPLNATVPLGVSAVLDGKRGELVVTESAVS